MKQIQRNLRALSLAAIWLASCQSTPDTRDPVVFRAPEVPVPPTSVVPPHPPVVTPPTPPVVVTPPTVKPPRSTPTVITPPNPTTTPQQVSRTIVSPTPLVPERPAPGWEIVQVKLPPPNLSMKVGGIEWVSLEAWGKRHSNSQFARLKSQAEIIHRLVISGLRFDVMAENRLAHCQGVQLWLGFAPKIIQGHLYLHHLDMRKHLDPLAASMPNLGRVVVIDPGHGANNLGTQSVFNKKHEKEYTLDWAMRLKPLLEARGWKVHLTRTADKSVANEDRVEFADRVRATLFISLHFNYAAPHVRGLETYCITPVGMPSHLTRGYKDIIDQTLPNNNYDSANLQLASRVHSQMLVTCGMEDRGVRRVRFMSVLKDQKRPAVLVEGGYLSNMEEAKLVATPEYRQKLAQAVAEALP
ncbi:MAG: N-acetylmuramoyl-L-alanine amidase [Pedosphaera sp.]|nr:N-acetylmuramoyl-L-alanine amidase [Pedosphaera sp.]MSU43401.1 N-acetylmuramoyl-L-alanine amidase [Pedosphaera sp.]